ncbi:hypothetical protein [Kitasatospora sp. GAS204B]|uniref:hypothetical protein n=1 Tax=unclassified Kitasatospora TaxID=2633591 RepID=UPI0024735BE5|nr:hypothetical protein [Kitasatospora sp. GAS204B]MDH6119325.1 hypothetical protein [Kitasatospora sp. GAS204B]
MQNRSKVRVAVVAAAALAAPLALASAAHASTGGGCRAWYSYSGLNVSTRPCISSSGATVNGSGYLSGSGLVRSVDLQLVHNGQIVAEISSFCDPSQTQWAIPAGQCTALDNISFGQQATGNTYYVDMSFTPDGLNWYGPTESPALNLS